jgi:hypothetical protein
MIWYKETLLINDAPPESKTELLGIYEPRGEDIITIVLSYEDSDIGSISKVIYSHNPSMLRQEEPSKEDIYNKYAAKINKIKKIYISHEDLKSKLRIAPN